MRRSRTYVKRWEDIKYEYELFECEWEKKKKESEEANSSEDKLKSENHCNLFDIEFKSDKNRYVS